MSTHTPTPWSVTKTTTKGEFCWDIAIRSADDSYICKVGPCSPEANAALIVRAVNTHAQLLEALNGVLHHNSAVKPHYQLPSSLIRQIESALAAAEGKE